MIKRSTNTQIFGNYSVRTTALFEGEHMNQPTWVKNASHIAEKCFYRKFITQVECCDCYNYNHYCDAFKSAFCAVWLCTKRSFVGSNVYTSCLNLVIIALKAWTHKLRPCLALETINFTFRKFIIMNYWLLDVDYCAGFMVPFGEADTMKRQSASFESSVGADLLLPFQPVTATKPGTKFRFH